MFPKDNLGFPSSPTHATSSPLTTRFRIDFFTLLAVKLLWSIRPCKGSVLMLTDRLCFKYGVHVHLSEASTMRFISERTSIPVPRIISAFTHGDKTYILMERIKGDMIGVGWVRRDGESKAKLLSQLKSMIQEIREIPVPEGTKIASADGGSIFDCRLLGGTLRFGPFDNIQDFHRYLRRGIDFDPTGTFDPEIQEFVKQHSKSWPLRFTHGDLSSLNILIRGNDIVGIIDWETSGWYPSYWEYTTACQVNPQNSFWIHEIDKFLIPMREELVMERTRQKYFGDI